VPMLWSRLFFQFFARPLLELDATMVTWLLGTGRIGNLVRFGDDSGYMVITPACASWANISYAFLCWVAVTQWANHRWSSIDLLWSSLAVISLVALNVVRIAITGLSYGHYQTIHNQYGEMVLGTISMCLIVGFTVIGSRRELFSRA
jgi:exosortase/archaeosortase family protein